jgi:hypothetical protein
MSNSRAATTIVCLLALCRYSCAFVQPNEVIASCRRRCLVDVVSGLTDVGYGDCFDECVESSSSAADLQQSVDKLEANTVGAEDAGVDRKRNAAAIPSMTWSKVFPRGVGSGSASKYLRIGRSGYGLDQADGASPAAEADDQKIGVERRRVSSSDRSSLSLTGGRLGNSAKSYLRVGKKSAEKV